MSSPITDPKQFMDLGQALAYLTTRNKPSATITLESCQTRSNAILARSGPRSATGETVPPLSQKERMSQFREGEL